MCVKHGVDVIYHASYIDDEGMDMLEKKKDRHIVAPGINWLIATCRCHVSLNSFIHSFIYPSPLYDE
jgi:hypothetical protein